MSTDMPLVTPLYAAMLATLFIALSVRALRLRRQLRIPVGDGGDPRMLRAMRTHANFAEYAPLTLVLILMFELLGGPAPAAHLLGLGLLAGRLSHAYGVSRIDEDFRFRVSGMVLTFTALSSASLGVLTMWLVTTLT